MFIGEVEADKSYFSGRRKSKWGRDASGRVPVFALFRRNKKVYNVTIPDAKSDTLLSRTVSLFITRIHQFRTCLVGETPFGTIVPGIDKDCWVNPNYFIYFW